MNITITFDITPRLFAAVKSIVDAERPRVPSIDVPDSEPEMAVESTEPEKATEAKAESEKPKKRQKRAATEAKDSEPVKTAAPSQDPAPAPAPETSPAIGDKSSPVGDAEPERATPEETNAPETTRETTPVEEASEATSVDPLAGKGQTGEILAELTRKAIGDLDALGVDRGDANRRIRAYCDYHEIKFPTFPALLNAVGYAEAIAICKGA